MRWSVRQLVMNSGPAVQKRSYSKLAYLVFVRIFKKVLTVQGPELTIDVTMRSPFNIVCSPEAFPLLEAILVNAGSLIQGNTVKIRQISLTSELEK